MDDITNLLKKWDYIPDDVTVRIIQGDDKKPKVQMRLDLGLLQMEFFGRPDGKTPHNCESLLDYYQDLLERHITATGSDEGFTLDACVCTELRSEALQYYYRYLSLFHLKEYQAVERDTARNLRAFKFIRKYAEDEDDRFSLEQYRPYVIMMNTRARAYLLLDEGKIEDAQEVVETGIRKIRCFFKEFGRPRLADKCSETLVLKKFIEEIRHEYKNNPVDRLRSKMQEAVSREDYESAAQFRDEIRKLTQDKVM
jgi:hypothetical protein